MAPTQDPSPSPDDRASNGAEDGPSAEWYAERWSVLADVLDVSDPRKVVSRVRALQKTVDVLGEDVEEADDPALRELREQLERLRAENAEQAAPAATDDHETRPGPNELHPKTERLLNQLDAASLSEAQDRVRGLNQQVENLYSEKETLAEAGLMSAEDALDEIDRLQKKYDRLQAQPDRPEGADGSGDAASSPPADLPAPAGLTSQEEVRELLRLAHETVEGLEDLASEADVDVPFLESAPDDALVLVRTAREQVAALQQASRSPARNDAVADALGIDSVEEAQELDRTVRRMSERLDTLSREKKTLAEDLGIADADAILDLVQSMEGQLSALYDRQDDRTDAGVPPAIEDVLGISTVEEARELEAHVRAMSDRLDQLAAEHEALASKNLDAKKALAVIDSMEAQLNDLYRAADASRNGTRKNGKAGSSPTESDDQEVDWIDDILGISGPSEARELNQAVRRMSEELNRLRAETEALAESDLTAETALHMIDSMEEQLVALYHSRDEASASAEPSPPREQTEAVEELLGASLPGDAGGAALMDAIAQRLESLLDDGRGALPDADDVESLDTLLREINTRLELLRSERDTYADRAGRLEAIEEILGISTLEEAEELTELVQGLDAQLQTLYAEREKLNEVGLSSVEDAVEMIRSMEGQLQELYQEQEALLDQPPSAQAGQQDTFEQLATLYKEQEKLKRALGVSSAEDVIEMVEALSAQLDDVYASQDQDRDAPVPSPEPSTASPSATGTDGETSPSSAEVRMTLDSMRDQLEMLYEEREALLSRGLETAEEAAARIDDLEGRVETLQRRSESCEEQLQRLESELGTSDVTEIVQMAKEGASLDAAAVPSRSAASPPDDDPFVDAAPAPLPDATLNRLDEMSPSALDDLSVGVLRLSDQGVIQSLNEAGMTFPGLGDEMSRDRLTGQSLFELVPGTSNTLFLGRFRKGVEQGEMDARFPYTFVEGGDPPTVYFIHLYRAGDGQANWLLFQPA